MPYLPIREVTAISIVVLLLVSYLWVRAITGGPVRYAGAGRVSKDIIVLTIAGSFAIVIPALSLGAFLLEYFEAPPEIIEALVELIRADGALELLYAILVTAIGGSLSEEFVFRGILQNSLSNRLNSWAALIITSAVFGLLHTVWRLPGAFLLGMFLGYLYMRTGSLIPSLLAHAVINTTSIVLFNYAESVPAGTLPEWLEQDKPAPLYLIALSVVAFSVVIAAVSRRTARDPYPLQRGYVRVGGPGEAAGDT